MRTYFEKFGELTFSQLKKKADGSSRGYGFIRFKDIADQVGLKNADVDIRRQKWHYQPNSPHTIGALFRTVPHSDLRQLCFTVSFCHDSSLPEICRPGNPQNGRPNFGGEDSAVQSGGIRRRGPEFCGLPAPQPQNPRRQRHLSHHQEGSGDLLWPIRPHQRHFSSQRNASENQLLT